jgi:hypothetical protein
MKRMDKRLKLQVNLKVPQELREVAELLTVLPESSPCGESLKASPHAYPRRNAPSRDDGTGPGRAGPAYAN